MESLLKLLFKYFVLIVAIVGAHVGNAQNLPPCCAHPGLECQPIHCPKLPCCKPSTPPNSDTKL
jgi:hypothetical protein